MAHMTLVRHGQAQSGAQDEASYDRLSDLGHQQAQWLGAHFQRTEEHFVRVYTGTMRRHIETAESMGAAQYGEVIQDPRLNEFPYFSLEKAMQDQHREPVAQSREEFARHLPKTLDYWAEGRLEGVDESFEAFTSRVTDVIAEIAEGPGQALVVTSGGFISTVMQQTLALNTDGWARMCLAIFNSSTHRFQSLLDRPILTQFNGIPHLEGRDRQHARTHI
ncbi:histidine phosphatase family protein [Cognatishimia maritima]|uniref:Broad specificity phosphatase PhoE n=1 Tax=Cognatishimia maritima TaxID=870908 RepID=A0A1M5SQC7_9RHOB|nr:histidine phosphatase family protein [Cognatishimia maritima]SHH40729.1 Broad specificity phosphatase PhoE [Cognatishimia maritima]